MHASEPKGQGTWSPDGKGLDQRGVPPTLGGLSEGREKREVERENTFIFLSALLFT